MVRRVRNHSGGLCRRYSGQPAFEFVEDGHDVGEAWQGSGAQADDDFGGGSSLMAAV
jgi:hypothetical protein